MNAPPTSNAPRLVLCPGDTTITLPRLTVAVAELYPGPTEAESLVIEARAAGCTVNGVALPKGGRLVLYVGAVGALANRFAWLDARTGLEFGPPAPMLARSADRDYVLYPLRGGSLRLTLAAQRNVEETGADPLEDLARLRAGDFTVAGLLASCLEGADAARVAGWRDYVEALSAVVDGRESPVGR